MGVIARQSFKHSIVNYLMVVVGSLASIFVYPQAAEEYGFIQILLSISGIVFPFVLLGTSNLLVRYFPYFENPEKKHSGFFVFILVLATGGVLLFFLIFPFVQSWLIDHYVSKDSLSKYAPYFAYLPWMICFLTYIRLFAQYGAVLKRIVIPNILERHLFKLAQPLLLLLLVFGVLGFRDVLNGILLVYALALLGLFFYIRSLDASFWAKPDFAAIRKVDFREMASFAVYGMLGGIGSQFAVQIDTLMVGALVEIEGAGIYRIASFIADAVGLPYASLFAISAPVIATAWKQKDMSQIEGIYQKSSLILTSVGLLLFLMAWFSFDDIAAISSKPSVFIKGKYVFLMLGISKLFRLFSSFNDHIILFSKYFRFSLYFMLLFAVGNYFMNLWLVPLYGLVGAATATMISTVVFNLLKMSFIQWRFKMLPGKRQSLYILLIALLVALVAYILPAVGIPLVDIALRSLIISLLFVTPILYFRISPDLNELAGNLIDRIRSFVKSK
ncbi:MAG: polysaccharide biosynthesis C-terminal domain-containing protein [Bacteroidota bacterium]